jgi:ABC-type transport system involved in cytochrome c biogenesis ATPase subunit
MEQNAHHESLRLQNFTVFGDVEFKFVSGINVLIGPNGSGKTHAMKAMYAFQLVNSRPFGPSVIHDDFKVTTPDGKPYKLPAIVWKNSFQTVNLSSVIRRGAGKGAKCKCSGFIGGNEWNVEIVGIAGQFYPQTSLLSGDYIRPVFIPATDMINHSLNFVASNTIMPLDFDQTCQDVIDLMVLERANKITEHTVDVLLWKLVGGIVRKEEGDRFYTLNDEGETPTPMEASGIARIATLARLYQNGWLPPGGTLFWDEPELSLNPVLMRGLIEVLLALARTGVQVVMATHSYVILKELDLQATKSDSIQFISIYKEAGETKVAQADDLTSLEPNVILDHYGSLFDRELDRSIKDDQQ